MREIWNNLFRMAERDSIPIAAHFDLTYRCNLRCIHCYIPESSRHSSVKHEDELTTQEIYGILDQLSECGTLFITFSGGEIFVRHDALDIIEYARKKKFHVSLMTTCTMRFDESVADKLAELGMRIIDISVYSAIPEVHDSVTGIQGSFSRTINAIELLNERGVKIRLKCPVMKNNVGAFRGVYELARSYDIYSAFDPNITLGKDRDDRTVHLRIDDEELADYWNFYMQIPDNGERKDAPPPLRNKELTEGPCGGARFSCYISPYGHIQPCIEINMICGNLRETPFKDIWENSEEMLMVRAIQQRDFRNCPDCPKSDFCFRCMGQSYNESGDLLAPIDEFCRITKARRQAKEEVHLSAQRGEEKKEGL